MRRFEAILIGAVLAVFLVGVSVRLLTVPAVTRVLLDATGGAQISGLEVAQAHDLAEQVRAYVTGANPGPLPERVADREGFSADAVSHLDDVRAVFALAGWATVVFGIGLGAWTLVRCRGGQRALVASAMRYAAGWIFAVSVLAVLAALVDFGRFFASFHALFFDAGTWQFPPDDLLIQLFPEPFWVTAGALWAGLVLLGAGALMLCARAVAAHSMRDPAT